MIRRCSRYVARAAGHGSPKIVVKSLAFLHAVAFALFLGMQIERLLARIAVDALRHQCMRGVEQPLHLRLAVALFAACDIAFGESEIIENAVGVRPLPELIIVLEEVIVTESRMGDHKRLHRGGVFLHDVADARIGIDDDLIGETLQSHAIDAFVLREALAERPVPIEQRHAGRRIGVQHLLGRNDLDLIGENVEAELLVGDPLDRVMNTLNRPEIPILALEKKRTAFHCEAPAMLTSRRWNSCRNTG